MRLELNRVSVEHRAIVPRLKFDLELYNDESEDYAFFNFLGDAYVSNGSPTHFGSLIPSPFGTALGGNTSRSLTMNLDIDIHKINAIEEIRKGKDLWIKLNVSPIYRKRTEQNNVNITQLWVQQKSHGDTIMIPQSEWVKILENLNYGNYKIIEMPLPRLPQGTALDKAIGHLEEAQRKFNEGEYDDVLVDCRDAVEEIHSVLKSIEKNNKSLRGKFTDTLGKEKEDRVEGLSSSFKLFVDLGGHKVIPEVKKIDRTDAELAIRCAHELVYFYAKRLVRSNQN